MSEEKKESKKEKKDIERREEASREESGERGCCYVVDRCGCFVDPCCSTGVAYCC